MNENRPHVGRNGFLFDRWLAEDHRLKIAKQSGKGDRKAQNQWWRQPWVAFNSGGEKEKFAGKYAKRRKAGNGTGADEKPPADKGLGTDQAAYLTHLLCAGNVRGVADCDKNCRFGKRVDNHMQQSAKGGQGSANAESKGHKAHMFN